MLLVHRSQASPLVQHCLEAMVLRSTARWYLPTSALHSAFPIVLFPLLIALWDAHLAGCAHQSCAAACTHIR